MPDALTIEDDLTLDIIGVQEYAPATPKKKAFLPWHKPRKQFVRQMQWCKQISRMINDALPENNVLKYLGLPGDDLLDLRFFHRLICQPNNLRLRFLGFNQGAAPARDMSAELNISLDEINKLPFIDPTSDIIGDNICQIANINSIAWARSKKMGPFDVINIDLCDGFGKQPNNRFIDNHYNTLLQLMTLQARRVDPWLLLITTRTGPEHTDDGIFQLLKNLYGQNLLDCPSFLTASQKCFSISDNATLNAAAETAKGNSSVFLVSLCKWITSIAVGQNPPAKLELKSVIGYKVNGGIEHQDLVSIALKIEPTLVVANDRIGLASQQQERPSECNIAVQVLTRVSNLVDADSVLQENPELLTEMIATTSSLLEEARYDVSTYLEWANQIQ